MTQRQQQRTLRDRRGSRGHLETETAAEDTQRQRQQRTHTDQSIMTLESFTDTLLTTLK